MIFNYEEVYRTMNVDIDGEYVKELSKNMAIIQKQIDIERKAYEEQLNK